LLSSWLTRLGNSNVLQLLVSPISGAMAENGAWRSTALLFLLGFVVFIFE